MPSDSDATPCEGILMCDEESCESLKSAMEAAGQKSQNKRRFCFYGVTLDFVLLVFCLCAYPMCALCN